MALRIVGFNLSHDSSACLVEDGRIHAALALERTTRVKRGVVPTHAYASAMADLSQQLLGGMGVDHSDIDFWIASSTESRDQHDEQRLASTLGLLVPTGRCLVLPHPGHHLAHASAAFYASGFDSAAAIVIDAYGSRVGLGRERETAFTFTMSAAPQRVLQTSAGSVRYIASSRSRWDSMTAERRTTMLARQWGLPRTGGRCPEKTCSCRSGQPACRSRRPRIPSWNSAWPSAATMGSDLCHERSAHRSSSSTATLPRRYSASSRTRVYT
jgi:hypothetical protein